MKNEEKAGQTRMRRLRWLVIAGWVGLLVMALINRDHFTLEALQQAAPDDFLASAAFLLALFALKSLTFFVYAGLLYMLSGLLFPMPLCFLISVLGSLVMCALPYAAGRWLGEEALSRLPEKYPSLQSFHEKQNANAFLAVIILRLGLRLPSDAVSLYCGASHMPALPYLAASVLACLPNLFTLPLIGSGLLAGSRKEFWLGAGLYAGVFCLSALGAWLWSCTSKSKAERKKIS